MTLEDLVVKWKSDNQDVDFREILKRLKPVILSMVKTYGWLSYSGDDVKQECSLAIMKAALKFNPEKSGDFKTFAYFSCKHATLLHCNRRQRQPVGMERNLDQAPEETKESGDADEVLIKEMIQISLAISERNTKALLGVTMEGKTAKQVGEDMGVSRQRVQQYMAYAIRDIKLYLS